MKSSRAIPRAIGFAIVLFALTASIWWLFYEAPIRSAREAALAIKEALNFNGRITIGKTIFIEGNRDITELAIREKSLKHTYSWKHEWLMSSKEIVLEGTFRCKAGYDFTDKLTDATNPWGIMVSQDRKVITARMPNPSILSVEMTDYKIIKDEDGTWNELSKEDREKAVNALQRGARSELEDSGILKEVDSAFMKQIEDATRKSAPSGFKVIRPQLP